MAVKEINSPNPEPEKKTPALDNFGRNLTDLAKEGKIDPIIGRNKEIERVCQILTRRRKNNPILIGFPGVGKSHIAAGIASKIVNRDIPRILYDKKVIELDMGAIVAGTKYRGQFEERMKVIIEEIKKSDNIILFIDEIHTIIGAGSASGSLDGSNFFKPALASGELQCIGATTLKEYREHIEQDPALARRFQKVLIEPPTINETLEILNQLKGLYEDYHNVKYSDESLKACVHLSDRYITDRFFPDKAIDIMDETGSRVHIKNINVPKDIIDIEELSKKLAIEKEKAIKTQNYEEAGNVRDLERETNKKLKNELQKWEEESKNQRILVTEDHVTEVIAITTGIPIERISTDESKKLLNLDKELMKIIIGQDEAIKSIVKAIKRSKIGMKDKSKPSGIFFFAGVSGIGKSYLATKLSELIYENSLVRLDMSEYEEKHSVSKITGCFTPETLILMSDGKLKPISEIKIGESVITHLGHIKKVIDKYQYNNTDLIDSYRISNTNILLECTKQHEILAIKPTFYNKRIDKKSYNKENAKFYHSNELNVGDILMYPKNIQNNSHNEIIDLKNYIFDLSNYKFDDKYVWAYNTIKINRFININIDFVRFVGYYLSEGGCGKTKKQIKFTFNIKEKKYVNELCLLINKIFGKDIKPTIKENLKSNSINVFMLSKVISSMIIDLFGRTCYEKKLPSYFMNLDNNLLINLLETSIFGDGTKTLNRKMIYKTVSIDLASQFNTFFRKLNYSTQFNKIPKHKNCANIYHVILTGINIKKFNIEFPNLKLLESKIKPKNIQRLQYQDNNYFYYQIKEKNEKEYNGLVYDLSIENDASYIAGGISVHNSPPGYIGYNQHNGLTEKIRHKPHSIILLDEIEKAHPDVWDLFLQMFDEGHLTDSSGIKVDFKNTIIIMTSNIGTKELATFGPGIGFKAETTEKNLSTSENISHKILKSLEKTFKPEFINRIDDIIVFNTLSTDDLLKIVDLELKKVQERIEDLGYILKLTKQAKSFIVVEGYDQNKGAREIKRVIQKYVEDPIADLILNNLKKGSNIIGNYKKSKDKIVFKIIEKTN